MFVLGGLITLFGVLMLLLGHNGGGRAGAQR
jgi:hypothetical protein